MISKLIASVKKEALLLLRDRVGLSILFIMPMVLIFVMTLIQDAAFKTINEKGIPIVFVNNDNDSLGNQIANGLMHNDLCSYNDSINGKLATAELAQKAVADGKFLVGVVIPKGATEAIRKSVTNLVNQTLDNSNLKASTNIAISDSVEITILIDPVAKKSFINSVTSNLHEFISEIKTKIMFQTFSEQIADVIPDKKMPQKVHIAKHK